MQNSEFVMELVRGICEKVINTMYDYWEISQPDYHHHHRYTFFPNEIVSQEQPLAESNFS